MQQVLTGHEFAIAYQPILNLDNGSLVGFEALFRPSPDTPFPGPEEFFREAERAGLLLEANAAAAAEAIRQAEGLPAELRLFLNIDPRVLEPCLNSLPLLPAGIRLVIELTENVPVQDVATIVRLHRRMQAAGMELAIDDLGAGYASLSLLMALRPCMAKLDGTLVRGLHRDPVRRSLIHGLVRAARLLGTRLVGEQVEEPEDLQTLLEVGVGIAQGYYIGRALPWREAKDLGQGFAEEVQRLRERAEAYRLLHTATEVLEASTASLWQREGNRLYRLFNLHALVPPGEMQVVGPTRPVTGTAHAFFVVNPLPAASAQSPAGTLPAGEYAAKLVLLLHRIAVSFAFAAPRIPLEEPDLAARMRSAVALLELLDVAELGTRPSRSAPKPIRENPGTDSQCRRIAGPDLTRRDVP